MVDGLGSWRWDKFSEALPPSILVRISTVKGPTPWPVQVSIGWKGTLGAKFSVRDAYLIWTDHAELWGVHVGLEVAWSFGCWKLLVELDNQDAIHILQQHHGCSGVNSLVLYIQEALQHLWVVV
ncbi:hypothetical protein V6N13_033838 [Hibiscus sabdariffa]